MAAISLHLFENVEDEKAFCERRFHKSIMFMHSVNRPRKDSRPVSFGVFKVGDTKTYASLLNPEDLKDDLRNALNLEPVRIWTLVRRGKDVFFVGESSEAIIADNVVPLEIRVEGGEDAERCWSRA